jgi:hypothetical protein
MQKHLSKQDCRPHPQSGLIMVAAMVMVTCILAIGFALSRRTAGNSLAVSRDYQEERTFYVSDGGADYANAWLINLFNNYPDPTQTVLNTLVAPSVPGYQFAAYSITKQPALHNVLITQGPQEGLMAQIQPYLILSHARNSRSTSDQVVHVTVNKGIVGLYQYGIFYDGDMEIFPTWGLDYMGRIHVNGNLYCGSHNTLDVESRVTVAGHIYDFPIDPTLVNNGKVRFRNDDSVWSDLSYDSRDPNWVTKSTNDWDLRVQDSAHGVTPLPPPIPTTSVPHDLIERPLPGGGDTPEMRAVKYYYKSGLRIVNNSYTDSLGNNVHDADAQFEHRGYDSGRQDSGQRRHLHCLYRL